MGHLSTSELIDLLDDEARPSAHVAGCRRCEARLAQLRGTLGRIAAVDVPEPPAGFWDDLSARVHRRIAAEAEPAGARSADWRGWFAIGWKPALAMAAALVLLVAGVVGFHTSGPAVQQRAAVAAPAASPAPADTLTGTAAADATLSTSDPLELMAALSAGLDWDQAAAAGLRVSPASADAAVAQLSDEQRAELVRLLEQQLNQ